MILFSVFLFFCVLCSFPLAVRRVDFEKIQTLKVRFAETFRVSTYKEKYEDS
jgi:hypothetical protein